MTDPVARPPDDLEQLDRSQLQQLVSELRASLQAAVRRESRLGVELDERRLGATHDLLRCYLAESLVDHGDERLGRRDVRMFSPQEAAAVLAADFEIVGTSASGGILLRFSEGSGGDQEDARRHDRRFALRRRRAVPG